MTQGIYKILLNEKLTDNVFKMVLGGETRDITAPGQFINIKLEGKYLRRPISIFDYDENTITIIYKVVGVGTEQMSEMRAGDELDILVGLGNGYSLEESGEKPLLIGGGVGVPPLYNLAKKLIAEGKKVTVILGFNTKSEVFLEEDYKALGADVTVQISLDEKLVPVFAEINGGADPEVQGELQDILMTDLGIPKENQKWIWNPENNSS